MKADKIKQKKESIVKRNENSDPNNNKNLPEKKTLTRRGKKVKDDTFEHRTSRDTAF